MYLTTRKGHNMETAPEWHSETVDLYDGLDMGGPEIELGEIARWMEDYLISSGREHLLPVTREDAMECRSDYALEFYTPSRSGW
jgi:hypothetical protein